MITARAKATCVAYLSCQTPPGCGKVDQVTLVSGFAAVHEVTQVRHVGDTEDLGVL